MSSHQIAPDTEDTLAAAITDANGPLFIRGGGSHGLGPQGEGSVLTTSGLSGIELYEPGALTIVARAGTPVSEVNAVLESEGQHLPFEPMDPRKLLGTNGVQTIGGVAAANVSGPRRVQAGACRDSLIGARFVDGSGAILKNGGRVMKNVTGYDLVKLLAGSHGTLGVLSEVSFKVLPKPQAVAVCLIDGLSVPQAVEAMSTALTSPYEVTGAAHAVKGIDGSPVTMIRVEGFESSVTYRAEKLKLLLSIFGSVTIETDPERTKAGWAWIRDVETFAGREGDVWRVSVKPSDAPKVVQALAPAKVLLDWGGGLIWALSAPGRDIRTDLDPRMGHATLVRADSATRMKLGTFHPEPAAIAALSAGLRERFDPRGLLNPGLMA